MVLFFLVVGTGVVSCQVTPTTQASVRAFSESEWIAAGPEFETFDTTYPAPYFRKSFEVGRDLHSATAYVTAGGYFTFYLNGRKVEDRLLDPAVTRYDKTVEYVTFDVTEQLAFGANVTGAVLANGFYNVNTESAWQFDRAPWRNRPALLVELLLEYRDGSTQRIVSDDSWKWSYGPIIFNQLRNGEYYDSRLDLSDWSTPVYDDEKWQAATEVTGPRGRLCEQVMPPIKKTKTLAPVAITEPEPGLYVVDFGQNIAGWAGLTIDEPAGTEVRITYGERLYDDGTLDIEELGRFIKSGETQTTRYVASSDPAQYYEPWTTYFGFQYVEIEGLSQPPTEETIAAFMINTAFDTVGYFETSNLLINQLHENIRWSYLGNFHSFPEDCPHREKMGWTGDAQLVIETGLFNFDVRTAFAKWLGDFRDEQPASGALPGILPTSGWGYEIGHMKQPYYGPHWEGAAVTIPWQVYRWTGDTTMLRDNYGMMTSYLDFLHSQTAGSLLLGGIDDHKSIKTHTEGHYLSSAYYHWLLTLAADIAVVLGKDGDARTFTENASEVAAAFAEKYFDATDTTYGGGGQTPLAVALGCGLVPPDLYPTVLTKLVDTIRAENYHFDAGVIGVKKVIEVLLANGYEDVLYRMATRTDFPSFGHWVAEGANTMWQNWDGSQSRNHIMFGSIGDFFYQGLAGIRPSASAPGFREVTVQPFFPEDMNHLSARHRTPRGWLTTEWVRDPSAGGTIAYSLVVPPKAEVTLRLKDYSPLAAPTELARDADGYRIVRFGPGTHTLQLTATP